MNRHIGGSVLPSNCPEILIPIDFSFGKLEMRPVIEHDTHILVHIQDKKETILASHPNGYSCHALAKRMVSGDIKKTLDQAQYIVDCGGKVPSFETIKSLIP